MAPTVGRKGKYRVELLGMERQRHFVYFCCIGCCLNELTSTHCGSHSHQKVAQWKLKKRKAHKYTTVATT